jgi:nitric oxide reductase activation protein
MKNEVFLLQKKNQPEEQKQEVEKGFLDQMLSDLAYFPPDWYPEEPKKEELNDGKVETNRSDADAEAEAEEGQRSTSDSAKEETGKTKETNGSGSGSDTGSGDSPGAGSEPAGNDTDGAGEETKEEEVEEINDSG